MCQGGFCQGGFCLFPLSSPLNISHIKIVGAFLPFLALLYLIRGKIFSTRLYLTMYMYCQCHMIKNKFSGTPIRHCYSAITIYCRRMLFYIYVHTFKIEKSEIHLNLPVIFLLVAFRTIKYIESQYETICKESKKTIQIYPLPSWSNWGHKITDFEFLAF